jgi:hypothetical protein
MNYLSHNPESLHTIYEVQAVEAFPTPKGNDLLNPFFVQEPADTSMSKLFVTTQYSRGRVFDNLQQDWIS